MQLVETPQGLALEHNQMQLIIDFESNQLNYRQQHASKQNELIAKAVGIKTNTYPNIIDATAGLGRDAFILASLGCKITLIEKNDLLIKLLNDALNRAKNNPAIEKMNLIHADSIDYLKNNKADVVYLDPMFPERKKSAAVKKEMQMLQALTDDVTQEKDLLDSALGCATKRVVVKRPIHAEPLANKAPSHSIKGRSNRFDVYII